MLGFFRKRRLRNAGESPEEFAERVLRLLAESRDPKSTLWKRAAYEDWRRRTRR